LSHAAFHPSPVKGWATSSTAVPALALAEWAHAVQPSQLGVVPSLFSSALFLTKSVCRISVLALQLA